jgi:hypothetical protein
MLSVVLFIAITLSTIVIFCSAEINNCSVKIFNMIRSSVFLCIPLGLSVNMLGVIMPNVIRLSVNMMSVNSVNANVLSVIRLEC